MRLINQNTFAPYRVVCCVLCPVLISISVSSICKPPCCFRYPPHGWWFVITVILNTDTGSELKCRNRNLTFQSFYSTSIFSLNHYRPDRKINERPELLVERCHVWSLIINTHFPNGLRTGPCYSRVLYTCYVMYVLYNLVCHCWNI